MHTIFVKYEETKTNPEDEVISDIDVCFDFNLKSSNKLLDWFEFIFMENV